MRVVIKIGTSTIAHRTGMLNIRRSAKLAEVICDVANAGNEVVIVTSGAIGLGVGKLGLPGRPADIAGKQAAAAVGQCELMYTYDRLFGKYNRTVAQILLTGSDFRHEDRHQNFTNTVEKLLELRSIPIINENDTVATDEIKFGDNDTLSARVAVSVHADLLILLSDIDGLYTADPRKDETATLIREVRKVDESVYAIAGGSGSSLGTGGMKTKLDAAKLCIENGCDMIIANGAEPNVIYSVLDGTEEKCTRFIAEH